MDADAKILLYVAVDFGTTFSGYAFKFKHQEKIFTNSNWGKSVGCQSFKVPTCVLTDTSDNFVAFGYDAQEKFTKGDSDSEDEDGSDSDDEDETKSENPKTPPFHYYDEFKMLLEGEKAISNQVKITAYDGKECEATKIFAMALEYLKGHLMDHIKNQFETIPGQDEIKWVLTVPAIWSDSAKLFMRQCAVKAGMVSDMSSDQLLIALEPEAASLYCRTLDLNEFQLKENVENKGLEKGLPPDSHYMVVDCGGGTVDVTAHHYKGPREICELYAASGGKWGGRNVNFEYEKKLNEVLAKEIDIMQIFRETYPPAYLDTKVKFEKEKRSIDFTKKGVTYNTNCGYYFVKLCEEHNNVKINQIVKRNEKKHGVKFSNGMLVFPEKMLHEIFDPSINDIKNHILQLLAKEELEKIKYIYLVGGFSDCALLQNEVKQAFNSGPLKQKDIHVILAPYDASLAVVKGAVLFGSNPQAISSRRARRYYCTAKNPSRRGRSSLVPIVKQNEEIDNDDVRHTHFYPKTEGNIFRLHHYKVDEHSKPATIKYTNDNDVGVIEIDVSNLIGRTCTADTKISVYLHFGSTEIHVTARNDTTPGLNQVKESINCL